MAGKTTVLLVLVFLAAAGRCWAQEKAGEDGNSWAGWALNKLSEGIGMGEGEKTNMPHHVQKAADSLDAAARETSQYASQNADKIKQAASDFGNNAQGKTKEAYDSAAGMAGGAKDKASQAYDKASAQDKQAMEDTKKKANDAYSGASQATKDKASEAYKKASEAAKQASSGGGSKQSAQDAINALKGAQESAKQGDSKAYNDAQSSLNDAFAKVTGSMSPQDKQAYESAKEKASQAAGEYGKGKK